jgi:hypothetical protein
MLFKYAYEGERTNAIERVARFLKKSCGESEEKKKFFKYI